MIDCNKLINQFLKNWDKRVKNIAYRKTVIIFISGKITSYEINRQSLMNKYLHNLIRESVVWSLASVVVAMATSQFVATRRLL